MTANKLKAFSSTAYSIAKKLAANPQRTLAERLEADELRQCAARMGWGAHVSAAAAELAEGK